MRRPKLLLLVFIAAFSVRLIAVWALGPSQMEFGDSRDYLDTSRAVCTDGDYPARGNLLFFRAPGFPLFICLVTACDPDTIWMIKIANAAIDSLTVLLIWAISAVFTEKLRWQMVAVAVAVANPIFVYQTTDLRSEPLFMFFLTGALGALFLARKNRATHILPLAGVMLGLAALTRPAALVAIPLTAIGWMVGCQSNRIRECMTGALVLCASAAAVIGPWTLFMFAKHHEVILVNDAGGYNLWRGTHPELIEALESRDQAAYDSLTRNFETVTSPSEARAVSKEANSPMARSRAWRRRALMRIGKCPWSFTKAIAGNLLRFWRPWLNPMEHPTESVISSACFVLFVFVFGAMGIASIRTSDPWLFWFVICWFCVATIVHAPFQVVMRFRIPFTDPLLIASLGQGVCWAWRVFGRKGLGSLTVR